MVQYVRSRIFTCLPFRISFFLLVELVILVLTGLFALSVAIVISAGLGYTCNTFTEGKKDTS